MKMRVCVSSPREFIITYTRVSQSSSSDGRGSLRIAFRGKFRSCGCLGDTISTLELCALRGSTGWSYF